MRHIFRCTSCARYTLEPVCSCGSKTVMPKPAKYSPEDKYAQYRREVKSEEWKKIGYL